MENNKTTTLVKTEANRKNALKSTGPKTLEGKSIIRWNALKHGLLSKEITIKAGDGKESKAEFKVLLSELREDLQPEVSSKRCWLRRLLSVTGGSDGCSGAKPERYAGCFSDMQSKSEKGTKISSWKLKSTAFAFLPKRQWTKFCDMKLR